MERGRVVYEGLVAGILGYATVAITIGALDVLSGRPPLYTPSLLGQVVIGGFGPPTPGVVSPGPVFAYNGIHLLAFLVIGLIVSLAVWEVELHPPFWYAAFFALLATILVSLLVLALITAPLHGLISSTHMLIANALAAVVIGGYVHRAHPRLRERVARLGDPESDR